MVKSTTPQLDATLREIDRHDYVSPACARALKGVARERPNMNGIDSIGGPTLNMTVSAVGGFIDRWLLPHYSREAIVWGVSRGMKYGVNRSETKALVWMYDTEEVDHSNVDRRQSPDFVVGGSVGFEVKSEEDYSLRRAQLQAASELSQLHVVVSNTDTCYVIDTLDWVGLNELERIE